MMINLKLLITSIVAYLSIRMIVETEFYLIIVIDCIHEMLWALCFIAFSPRCSIINIQKAKQNDSTQV